jgi:tetratricopeptide (TPR) repeat protein
VDPITRTCSLLLAAALAAAVPARATPGDLGAYMRARAAAADGAVGPAAQDYAQALAGAPGDAVVALRAYREAMRAGDAALADRAAAVLVSAGVLPADAAVFRFAAAAQAGDPAAAQAAVARLEKGPLRILAAPLRAWTALAVGGDPLAPLATPGEDIVARRFAEETRALILIARGDPAGLAAVRAMPLPEQSGDVRIAAARLLIARGQAADARALLAGDGGAAARALADRAGDRAWGAQPTLAFGASQLFARVAADLIVGEPGALAYTLVQSALRADPANDRASLLLASLLSRDDAAERALAVIDRVPARSLYADSAAAARVQVLAAAGRDADALGTARALAAQGSPDDLRRLADLYARLGQPADAAALYKRLLDRAGDAADWSDWLQYAAVSDAAGDWPHTRAALERAAARAPDEPLVLNYFGYALILRRERVAAAQAMLEKAARLKPDDAAIADSLGWSLYLRGQAARALPLIERAAAAEPANAEIAEHLGDAYWQLGRRYEARYAWTAARQTAEGASGVRLDDKIADGL